MGDYETVTDLATISLRPSPAEVELDRVPELLGAMERLRTIGYQIARITVALLMAVPGTLT